MARVDDYKGYPVLNLEDGYCPTRLGVGKLRAVAVHMEDVLQFLADQGETEAVEQFNRRFTRSSNPRKEVNNEQTDDATVAR